MKPRHCKLSEADLLKCAASMCQQREVEVTEWTLLPALQLSLATTGNDLLGPQGGKTMEYHCLLMVKITTE
jgi:hypothetical protein